MRKSRISESQIIGILKQVERGRSVWEVCREHGVSEAAYYRWKSKYGGMEAADIRRLKELEEENRRLKQLYADLSLENRALQDAARKPLRPDEKRELLGFVRQKHALSERRAHAMLGISRSMKCADIPSAGFKEYHEERPHESLGDLTPKENLLLHYPEVSRLGGTDLGRFTIRLYNSGQHFFRVSESAATNRIITSFAYKYRCEQS